MKALKGLINLVLVLCILTFAQQAYALPISSYAENVGNWQGSSFHNDGTIHTRIDYAVYDTSGTMSGAESTFVSSIESVMPDMAQYLYVYQVFNDLSGSESPIAYFAVFNLDETVLDVSSQNIGEKDDGAGGIEPSYHGLDDEGTRVVWEFTEQGKVLLKDYHSWYLVLSSAGAPVKGDYEVKSSTSDRPSPPPIPEPATIALLSSGALIIAGRRKRK
jgi:hypothetical protein